MSTPPRLALIETDSTSETSERTEPGESTEQAASTGHEEPEAPTPPPRVEGLGTFAALPGAALGFCGTFTYVLATIVWQLGVDHADAGVVASLLPHPADWVTSTLTLTAYGLPSSAALGALAGLLIGWLLSRVTRSASPALGWVFGVVIAFALMVLVQVLLGANDVKVGFGQSVRLFTLPMIIFVIEGGLLGVWLQRKRAALTE